MVHYNVPRELLPVDCSGSLCWWAGRPTETWQTTLLLCHRRCFPIWRLFAAIASSLPLRWWFCCRAILRWRCTVFRHSPWAGTHDRLPVGLHIVRNLSLCQFLARSRAIPSCWTGFLTKNKHNTSYCLKYRKTYIWKTHHIAIHGQLA